MRLKKEYLHEAGNTEWLKKRRRERGKSLLLNPATHVGIIEEEWRVREGGGKRLGRREKKRKEERRKGETTNKKKKAKIN